MPLLRSGGEHQWSYEPLEGSASSCYGDVCASEEWPEERECIFAELPECGTVAGYCLPMTTPFTYVAETCAASQLRSADCALSVHEEQHGSLGVECQERWECLENGGSPAVCHGLYDDACAKLGL